MWELHRSDGRWIRFDPGLWHPSVGIADLPDEHIDNAIRVQPPVAPMQDRLDV
jgi:hypothetical protein